MDKLVLIFMHIFLIFPLFFSERILILIKQYRNMSSESQEENGNYNFAVALITIEITSFGYRKARANRSMIL